MSEQFSPPESQDPLDIPQVDSGADVTAKHAAVAAPGRRTKWIAPAWFLLGILIGALGYAFYSNWQSQSSFDAVAMRDAARAGTLDAIATLQAGGSASAEQQQQGPQTVASNAFTIREANRQGNPQAKVTVYEFSDFQ